MNKELSLDERIQKLFESGWVNEFNYLENQLQEARYLLACLNEKYNQLTNNWNELEEWAKSEKERFREIAINQGLFIDKELSMRIDTRIKLIDSILDKMKEIKEGNNENIQ